MEAVVVLPVRSVVLVRCRVIRWRCAPRRLALARGYAKRVWSMRTSGLVGRMSSCSTQHHRPNPPFNRSANGVAVGTRRALRAGARLMAFR